MALSHSGLVATADEYLRRAVATHGNCGERRERRKSSDRGVRRGKDGTSLVSGFMSLGRVTVGQTRRYALNVCDAVDGMMRVCESNVRRSTTSFAVQVKCNDQHLHHTHTQMKKKTGQSECTSKLLPVT